MLEWTSLPLLPSVLTPLIQTNALPIDYSLPFPIPFIMLIMHLLDTGRLLSLGGLLAICVLDPRGPCPRSTRT
jgi:hypothetical protein